MLCKFCGREVSDGAAECPYCHYVFVKTPSVLTNQERDNFDGTTIEDDGRAHTAEDDYRDTMRQRAERRWNEGVRGFQVHSSGCGLGSFALLVIGCLFIVMSLYLLPYAIMMAAAIAIYFWFKRNF